MKKNSWCLSLTLILATLFLFIISLTAVVAPSNYDYVSCWGEDGNKSGCYANESRGCTWQDSTNFTWCGNDSGCCVMTDCWTFDNDQTKCDNASSIGLNCVWEPNDQAQNPYCWNDVGCCETVSCWSKSGVSQNACENASFMGGICQWQTQAQDTWCTDPDGCCQMTSCNANFMQNETKCKAAIDLDMGCSWNTSNCTYSWEGGVEGSNTSGGACGGYNNKSNECQQSGWCIYDNATGTCEDPYISGIFTPEDFGVHCWFADNQRNICQNISGCLYCDADNTANASSFCNGKQVGWCEGHQQDVDHNNVGNVPYEFNQSLLTPKGVNYTSNNSLNCSDFNSTLSKYCDCGPLQGCTWEGTECRPGPSSCNLADPPFKFCDATNASGLKPTQADCNTLKNSYFMNCKWNNASSKCEFDWGVIGDTKNSSDEKDYYKITNKDDCVAAKGKWIEEKYCEGDSINTEAWCEVATGTGWDNCDDSCSACDWFFANGTAVSTATQANSACAASGLGYCNWTADSNAPNTLGRCAAPAQIYNSGGTVACDTNCKDCELITANASARCNVSLAACRWDTATSSCISNASKGCDTSCFSCYDSTTCTASNSNCSWDPSQGFCKATGFSNEICFDGVDNDNDGNVDCGDGDCSYDPFCGGAISNTCGGFTTEFTCTSGSAGETGLNCVWINPDWGAPYCDMPGAQCWTLNAEVGCDAAAGCNWTERTGASSFCDVNNTVMSNCTTQSIATCAQDDRCALRTDGFTGNQWCDHFLFSCLDYNTSTQCMANENCTWQLGGGGWDLGGGFCEPVCHNQSITCGDYNPFCVAETGMCEPSMFADGGAGIAGCGNFDGNKSGCVTNNATCIWEPNDNGPLVAPETIRGWCQQKGSFTMFADMANFHADHVLATKASNTSLPGEIDSVFITVKETPEGYFFQTGVRSINQSAFCKGYPLGGNANGAGTNKTRFYYYLETDGDKSNGCGAPLPSGSNDTTKYDFLIQHITGTESGTTSDTKTLMRCTGGVWGPTNAVASTKPSQSCQTSQSEFTTAQGVFGVMIQKESLEKFDNFKTSVPLTIMVTSGDANSSRNSPNRSIGPGTYATGSQDFTPVDCGQPGASSTDPKCSQLKIFGFIPKEDCFSSFDDDADGLTNCDDIDCKNEPICNSKGVNDGSSAYYWGNDKVAPQVLFYEVDTYPDGAFIKYDTNEPANGTVKFYDIDNNCSTVNKTIRDIGIIDPFMNAYKSWHDGPLDNFPGNNDALGYKLTNGSTYYYKLNVCDEAGNCATSACLNFSTAKSSGKKDCPSCSAVFKFTPPPGMDVYFDFGAGTYTKQKGTTCGTKVNYSQSKKAKIKIQTGNLSIELINVSIGGKVSDNAKSFNATEMPNEVAANVGGQTTGCIGLSKNKFEKMKSSGMIPEKLKVSFPKGTAGCSVLAQCTDCTSSATCSDITNDTGVQFINETATTCEWILPAKYDYI